MPEEKTSRIFDQILNRDSSLKKIRLQSSYVKVRYFWQYARGSFVVPNQRDVDYRMPSIGAIHIKSLTVIRKRNVPVALYRLRNNCVTLTNLFLLA
ncbi:hypothetical protein TNCV_2663501 [Trichonephila clavipes]|nr:hypothetical protein TNCV_2663501 [Trichonephila clavipes]